MKKRLFYITIVFVFVCMVILLFYGRRESNSRKWDCPESQEVIVDFERLYGCDFDVATRKFENELYGVWQVKDFVGWDGSSRYQWAGFYGDILIFCENAWISNGTPWYKPVYACYSAGMSELASEKFLNITWVDSRYDDQDGILAVSVCTERNQKFGDALEDETFLFILTDDAIIMEKNGSYWELEKVGEVEMNSTFSNVSITQQSVLGASDTAEAGEDDTQRIYKLMIAERGGRDGDTHYRGLENGKFVSVVRSREFPV